MKKLALVLVALGAAVAAALLALRARSTPELSPDRAPLARVTRRNIGTIVKATGVIKPRVGAEVRVGSRASGVVKRLYVQIGDAVEKGQLLAELDDRDLTARRDQAAADVRRSLAELRYAQADLDRKRELGAAKVIAPSELDLADRACAVAEQQLAVAQAALASAATQLDYARIVAPIAGVVASVSTQEGETVAASLAAPTFVTLIDLSRLEVWAYVDETDIGRIQLGQAATFTVDTYAEQEFAGGVTTIYPKAEIRDNVVNYVSVVKFDPPRDRILRPEMTATVRIALALRENVLSLPLRAVRWESGRAFVLLPHDGTLERRWITTGQRDDSAWEIVDGLREGEAVQLGDTIIEGERKP
jgi:RND family efflux transporter MFP subunit